MSNANEGCLQRMVRRAMEPVVGDRFKMPDGCEKEVVYVTEDGLVGWRDTWETGRSPVYFDELRKWKAIVNVWMGNGVTLVEANTGGQPRYPVALGDWLASYLEVEMNDAEILERAKRPVTGDRFEWRGQVCEVLDITSVRNVGDVVHYTFTAYGKTDYLSEFLKKWPGRVEKTIAGGAVFVPSNATNQTSSGAR